MIPFFQNSNQQLCFLLRNVRKIWLAVKQKRTSSPMSRAIISDRCKIRRAWLMDMLVTYPAMLSNLHITILTWVAMSGMQYKSSTATIMNRLDTTSPRWLLSLLEDVYIKATLMRDLKQNHCSRDLRALASKDLHLPNFDCQSPPKSKSGLLHVFNAWLVGVIVLMCISVTFFRQIICLYMSELVISTSLKLAVVAYSVSYRHDCFDDRLSRFLPLKRFSHWVYCD